MKSFIDDSEKEAWSQVEVGELIGKVSSTITDTDIRLLNPRSVLTKLTFLRNQNIGQYTYRILSII